MKRLLVALAFLALAWPAFAAEPAFDEAMALYADKQYAAAREIAEAHANAGNVKAMVMLGLMYQKGQGVSADLNQAVDWYSKAAEKNDVGAQFTLAQIYLDGTLGDPDIKRNHF